MEPPTSSVEQRLILADNTITAEPQQQLLEGLPEAQGDEVMITATVVNRSDNNNQQGTTFADDSLQFVVHDGIVCSSPEEPTAERVPLERRVQEDPPARHTTEIEERQQQQGRQDPVSVNVDDDDNDDAVDGDDDADEEMGDVLKDMTAASMLPSFAWTPHRQRFVIVFVVVGALLIIVIGSIMGSSRQRGSPRIELLTSIDGDAANANFGSAIALSRTGNRLAVASKGVVTVYEKKNGDDATIWELLGDKMVVVDAADLPRGDELMGRRNRIAIEFNGNGDSLVVGYPTADGESGVVRVHRFLRGEWVTTTAGLSVGIPGDRFGASVSINAVGNVIAVGAPGYQNKTGRVYSFQENVSGEWELRQGDIEGMVAGGKFGGSISLSALGNRLAVGGRTVVMDNLMEDTAVAQYDVVQAYEFNRDRDFTWSKLGSGLRDSQMRFSTSWTVDLSADGNRYVASNSYTSEEDFINTAPDSLVVQALEFDGTSWIKMGGNIHQGIVGPKSGYFVALSDDGLSMVMGDPGTSSASSRGNGHAHIYRFEDGKWIQHGPNINGEADGDLFGYSIAIDGACTQFAAGAPLRSYTANDAGRVRIFSISNA